MPPCKSCHCTPFAHLCSRLFLLLIHQKYGGIASICSGQYVYLPLSVSLPHDPRPPSGYSMIYPEKERNNEATQMKRPKATLGTYFARNRRHSAARLVSISHVTLRAFDDRIRGTLAAPI